MEYSKMSCDAGALNHTSGVVPAEICVSSAFTDGVPIEPLSTTVAEIFLSQLPSVANSGT